MTGRTFVFLVRAGLLVALCSALSFDPVAPAWRVHAQAACQFSYGFRDLAAQIPDIVGSCLEDEWHGLNGDGLQRTTGGLLVWRKADNWTAFTNGSITWLNGPFGLAARP